MAFDVELLIEDRPSLTARRILEGLMVAAPKARVRVHAVRRYRGGCPIVMCWGLGRAEWMEVRRQHLELGGHVIGWDHGYVGRGKLTGTCRVTIDDDHPWRWMDSTEPDPSRWESFGLSLREDADPAGHIILAGMGPKSWDQLKLTNWEQRTLHALQQRFPGVEIRYRPKPGRAGAKLGVLEDRAPIEESLRGARLAVSRHSNVSVDAIIAGVPFECEDGAAYWMMGKPFTAQNRLDFLHRLCWWQWTPDEGAGAWEFLKRTLGCD